ncbi:MAG: Phage integrase family protein [Gammaproteobacteria bacterium]|jgi:hypothetical protein|nr:Phage integrase family protein [Gammaproteobacteria bacterium]
MKHRPKPFPIFDTANLFNIPPTKILLPEFTSHDLEVTLNFLKKYDNKITLTLYSREIERLLLWAWLVVKKSALYLNDQDIQKYIEFRRTLPTSWISIKKNPRFIKKGKTWRVHPDWRPFEATLITQHTKKIKREQLRHPLLQKEISRIFTVLNKFYTFFLVKKRAPTNPIRLAWRKGLRVLKQQLPQETVKRLTEIQWQYCVKAALQLAANDPDRHEKILFIITIFYLLYPLPSELVASNHWTPKMNHFYQDRNKNWWFKVHNNGRLRAVAVSDDMLNALKRYRLSKGLKPLPSPKDNIPLLIVKPGEGAIAQIWKLKDLVQQCFNMAAIQLRKNKLFNEANALKQATITWIRNTGISDDVNKRRRPIEHVREDVGYVKDTSKAIMNQYKT